MAVMLKTVRRRIRFSAARSAESANNPPFGCMRARVRGAMERGGGKGRGEPCAALTGVLRALLRGAGKTVRVAAVGTDRFERVFLLAVGAGANTPPLCGRLRTGGIVRRRVARRRRQPECRRGMTERREKRPSTGLEYPGELSPARPLCAPSAPQIAVSGGISGRSPPRPGHSPAGRRRPRRKLPQSAPSIFPRSPGETQ